MEPTETALKILYESIDSYIMLIIEYKKQKELFQEQIALFFSALTEVAEAEQVLGHFMIHFSQEMTKHKDYQMLFTTLKNNIANLQMTNSTNKMKIINEISSILEYHDLTPHTIMEGFEFLNDLAQNIDDQNRESVSRVFYMIGMKHKSQKELFDHAVQSALEQSKLIGNIPLTLDLIYVMIEEDLRTENYLNAFRRLDEVIEKIEQAPIAITKKFSKLLDEYQVKLAKKKNDELMDLLAAKHQIIRDKFLNQ